jgi:hypothetical protein
MASLMAGKQEVQGGLQRFDYQFSYSSVSSFARNESSF